jgi:O-antigen ligase
MVRAAASNGQLLRMSTLSHHSSSRAGLQVAGERLAGIATGRPRIAFMAVLLAAAMPLRIFHAVPLVSSASILDFALILVAVTLFLDLAFRPLQTGYPELFWLLCVPLVVSIISIVWSEDRTATLRTVLIYAEGLIAYLFVIRELDGLSPARIITYIKRFSYLLIIPGVLLLLHVPGFEPRVAYEQSSGAYLTFYTRLSHPVLGGSNNLATVLAFFAPILLYWGHVRHDRRATTAAFISILAIALTLSRGVLLAFLIAGVLYAPFTAGRRRRDRKGLATKIAATIALGLVALGVFYAVNPPTHEFFKDRLTVVNADTRSQLVSFSFEAIADKPLLGHGGGATPAPDAADDVMPVPDDGSGVSLTGSGQTEEVDVHNTYLQQALYFGLPLGLLISLALCGTAGVFLARRRSIALAGVIAYALMVQLVSFLFESSFEGTVLRVLFYLSVGMAAALLRSAERESFTTRLGIA